MALLKCNIHDRICGAAAGLNSEPKYPSVSFSSDVEFEQGLVLLVLHTTIGPTHGALPPLHNMPLWSTQGKIYIFPEIYKSFENELALLILIDEHLTGEYKYYILGTR
jgi:hypothetical protein